MIAPADFNFFDGHGDDNLPARKANGLTKSTEKKSQRNDEDVEYIHSYDLTRKVSATKLNDFLLAVSEGNLVKVRFLGGINNQDLDQQVNYQKDNDVYERITALGIAVLNNNVPLLRLLLKLGADINAGDTSPEMLGLQTMEESRDALGFLLDYKKEHQIKSEIASIF